MNFFQPMKSLAWMMIAIPLSMAIIGCGGSKALTTVGGGTSEIEAYVDAHPELALDPEAEAAALRDPAKQ